MQLAELMKKIATNTLDRFYIFYGEEQKILDIYLEHIAGLGYRPIYTDTVQSIVKNIGKKSLDNTPKLYIVNADMDYLKAENSWKATQELISKTKHIVVLRYNTLDKRNSFYKQNIDCIVEFSYLDVAVLTKYINNILPKLSAAHCDKICSMCGNDYGRILLEVDKVKHYMQVHKVSEDIAFMRLLEQDAIYADVGDITFKLTDAVLYGDIDTSRKYMMEALRKGEPAMVIASVLYTGFRNMLAVQGLGKDKSDAVKRTGLQYWQIKQVMDKLGGYSNTDLLRNMKLCQFVESGIKTGKIDDSIALEYLIVNCLK